MDTYIQGKNNPLHKQFENLKLKTIEATIEVFFFFLIFTFILKLLNTVLSFNLMFVYY